MYEYPTKSEREAPLSPPIGAEVGSSQPTKKNKTNT